MSVYVDTSVLVALFINDSFSARADRFVVSQSTPLIVSDFVTAEFASAISRRVRIKDVKAADARTAFADFDSWSTQATSRAEIQTSDVRTAASYLRRMDSTLRTGDAINIAIAGFTQSISTRDRAERVGDCPEE